jgi:DNA polymerase IV
VPDDPTAARSLEPSDRLEPAILHVDMDAFFAAVEVLDDPSLADKPVIVGGSGGRGVVASCTYEARAYGVRSAMPSIRARQLCPGAIFVDGHYSRYSQMSRELHRILFDVTPLVEPIGLDEAFLDVTGSRRLLGSPERIGHHIRDRVREELDLGCSVGVGRTKMMAKLASRAAKPVADRRGTRPGPGVFVVLPEEELAFLHPMPVRALWGVGPATAGRLGALGIQTVGELAAVGEDTVVRHLGKVHGRHLASLARGEDPGIVVPDRPAKSLGHEETFARDLYDMADLQRHAVKMAESVSASLREQGLAGRTITIKVKYADFSMVTRSHTVAFALDTPRAVAALSGALLDGLEVSPGVRLLGVSVSGLEAMARSEQLAFVLGPSDHAGERSGSEEDRGVQAARLQSNWQEVSAAVDGIRAKFGRAAVGTAAMVGDDGITVPQRREAPWGPSAEASDGLAAD